MSGETVVSHDLTGRVALVTGATRGIGRAIASALARAGATVVVCSRKDVAVAATVEAFRESGLRVEGIVANVGRPGEPERLVQLALERCGGIDILVNNAGVSPIHGPLTAMTPEAFDKIMAVNLKAPLLLAQLALPSMIARGGGVVLNISSIGAIVPEPDLGVYSASKAALVNLTKTMAREWGPHNIRANAICPGIIQTDFSAALWKDESRRSPALQRQPIARLGTPEDVAGLALYLASDAASFCTGSVFVIDGGQTLRSEG
ncbi:MAG TPA: SDR family oxidoreductase [Gemmatimonadaceae bacterium]